MRDERKILEMTIPDINVYPIFANPLAIMQNHKETEEWILCNFIQLCSNSEALNFYDFNYKLCPYLNIQRISKEYLNKMNLDLIEFMINSISEGYYVYLLVSRKEIQAYKFESEELRKQDKFAHDMLIYGYDLKEKTFYIADNFIDGKYSFQKCTFEELDLSLKNLDPMSERRLGFKGNLELIKFYNKDPQKFSVERIIDSLSDYILSKPTNMWNTIEFRNTYAKNRWYFGLECYDYLLQCVKNMEEDSIYIQDYHLLWEHKKHLVKIITFLVKNNYIHDNDYITAMKNIEKQALIARNLILKYGVTHEEKFKKEVLNIYSRMLEEEKQLINEVLDGYKESVVG